MGTEGRRRQYRRWKEVQLCSTLMSMFIHMASTKWTGDEWPNVWKASQVPGEKKHKYQGNHTSDLDTGYKKQKGTRGQLHISSKSTLCQDMKWHIKTLGKLLKPFWSMHHPHKFTIKRAWKVYWIKDMYNSMDNTITHSFFHSTLLFREQRVVSQSKIRWSIVHAKSNQQGFPCQVFTLSR